MTYQPRPGDYGVLATKGAFARLIQIGTLSPWNHVIIYIGDGWIVEATPRGVIISHLSKYDDIQIAWNQHEQITDAQRAIVVQFVLDQVGDPYGFLDIGILGARSLGMRLPHLFVNEAQESKGWICSQLAAAAFAAAGIILDKKTAMFTTPRDTAVRLIFQ